MGVYPGEENKGVVLQYKKKGMSRKPSEMYARVVMNSKNPRKVYRTIRKVLGTQNYRRDLIGVRNFRYTWLYVIYRFSSCSVPTHTVGGSKGQRNLTPAASQEEDFCSYINHWQEVEVDNR